MNFFKEFNYLKSLNINKNYYVFKKSDQISNRLIKFLFAQLILKKCA